MISNDLTNEKSSGQSIFQNLFSLLEGGEVSLLNSPPLSGSDPERAWVVSQFRMNSLKNTALMKECLSAFSERHTNRPASQLTSYMDAEIHSDLLRLQTQPCIRKDYRRFVVITTRSPNSTDSDMYKAGVCMRHYLDRIVVLTFLAWMDYHRSVRLQRRFLWHTTHLGTFLFHRSGFYHPTRAIFCHLIYIIHTIIDVVNKLTRMCDARTCDSAASATVAR